VQLVMRPWRSIVVGSNTRVVRVDANVDCPCSLFAREVHFIYIFGLGTTSALLIASNTPKIPPPRTQSGKQFPPPSTCPPLFSSKENLLLTPPIPRPYPLLLPHIPSPHHPMTSPPAHPPKHHRHPRLLHNLLFHTALHDQLVLNAS